MDICLVEGVGRDFELCLFDALIDSSAVIFVGCKDVLNNGENSQFDYWLCLIGNWCVEGRCKRFNYSCKMVFVSLGNKENYQYSDRGSRYLIVPD